MANYDWNSMIKAAKAGGISVYDWLIRTGVGAIAAQAAINNAIQAGQLSAAQAWLPSAGQVTPTTTPPPTTPPPPPPPDMPSLGGFAGEGGRGEYSPFKEYGDIGSEFYGEEPYAGYLRKLRKGYGISGEGPVSQFAQGRYGQQRGKWLMDYLNQEMMGQDATPWTDYTPQWGATPGAFQRMAGQFNPQSLGQLNYDALTDPRGARDVFGMALGGTQMAGPIRNWFRGQQENLYQRWLSENPPGLEGERTSQREFLPWLAQYTGR